MSNNNIINSIVISADHAGFELKNELKAFLSENYTEIKIIDAGAFEYDAEDDFPDMTKKLTEIIRDFNLYNLSVGLTHILNN